MISCFSTLDLLLENVQVNEVYCCWLLMILLKYSEWNVKSAKILVEV